MRAWLTSICRTSWARRLPRSTKRQPSLKLNFLYWKLSYRNGHQLSRMERVERRLWLRWVKLNESWMSWRRGRSVSRSKCLERKEVGANRTRRSWMPSSTRKACRIWMREKLSKLWMRKASSNYRSVGAYLSFRTYSTPYWCRIRQWLSSGSSTSTLGSWAPF